MATHGITTALLAKHAGCCCCGGFTVPVHTKHQQDAAKRLKAVTSSLVRLGEITLLSQDLTLRYLHIVYKKSKRKKYSICDGTTV